MARGSIRKTKAILVRTVPYSNTSQIVQWLTPGGLAVSTLVKGAQRPKSPFLGQYDAFYTCELLYYENSRNGLHIASACCPLRDRQPLRSDWRAFAAASYLMYLVSRAIGDGADHPDLFALTEQTLDNLAEGRVTREQVFWFELRLLNQLGMAPRLNACASCGSPLPETPRYIFSCERGGLVCRNCTLRAGRGQISLAPDALAILRRWAADGEGRSAHILRCSSEQLLVIQRILAMFMIYHLDVTPEPREIAMSLMATGSPHLQGARP